MREQCLQALGLTKTLLGGFVDGAFFASGASMLEVRCPTTESQLGNVRTNNAADYERIVAASVAQFQSWRLYPAPKRGELVRRVGDVLRKHKDALGELISLEMGKSVQEGKGEVQEMIDMADFACGMSRQLCGQTMHSERPAHRMYEQWHPIGPVGVISAFNFPMAVWSWNAFVAAICGDTVIWKPSLKTPLSAIAVQKLCQPVFQEAGFPNVFTLFMSESHDLTEYFVKDKKIPLISFTGSTAVGRHVNEWVAARLGRCLLELGGNNALIVDETADLRLVIPAVVFGSVGTSGQRCTTTRRVYIHVSRFDIVMKQLADAYGQLCIGDPLKDGIHMGPLVDKHAVGIYQEVIARIKKEGGVIRHGGNVLKQTGCFVEPTLVEVKMPISLMQEEHFVPILYCQPYHTLDEAIALQNNVDHGLSSALFTTNLRHAEQFLSSIGSDCGIANVNIGTSGAEIGGAFGGEKDTGGGREAGSDAWKAYMRRQTNTINYGADLPLAQGIEFKITT